MPSVPQIRLHSVKIGAFKTVPPTNPTLKISAFHISLKKLARPFFSRGAFWFARTYVSDLASAVFGNCWRKSRSRCRRRKPERRILRRYGVSLSRRPGRRFPCGPDAGRAQRMHPSGGGPVSVACLRARSLIFLDWGAIFKRFEKAQVPDGTLMDLRISSGTWTGTEATPTTTFLL